MNTIAQAYEHRSANRANDAGDASIIDLQHVGVTYRGTPREVTALQQITLTIAAGEPVSLIGPSGCGKSTLLNVVAGLTKPTTGQVFIKGEPITGPQLRTSLILQDYGLLPWKTVQNNAALGLTLRKMPRAQARANAYRALETVGIAEFADAYPSQLSGGMRQRLALARAMALNADILLMDEPLSALDSLTREELQAVLLRLWQQGQYAQILVTHSIEEAVFLGRSIVLMTPRPGRIRTIIENPGMGDVNYRQAPEFYEKCTQLRQMLSEACAEQAPDVELCDA